MKEGEPTTTEFDAIRKQRLHDLGMLAPATWVRELPGHVVPPETPPVRPESQLEKVAKMPQHETIYQVRARRDAMRNIRRGR